MSEHEDEKGEPAERVELEQRPAPAGMPPWLRVVLAVAGVILLLLALGLLH